MLYGNFPKSLKRSMTISRMSSIKRLEMRWTSGPDSSTDTAANLRSLNSFAHSADNIWAITMLIPTAKKTTKIIWEVELLRLRIPSTWVVILVTLACITRKMSLPWTSSARRDISLVNQASKEWLHRISHSKLIHRLLDKIQLMWARHQWVTLELLQLSAKKNLCSKTRKFYQPSEESAHRPRSLDNKLKINLEAWTTNKKDSLGKMISSTCCLNLRRILCLQPKSWLSFKASQQLLTQWSTTKSSCSYWIKLPCSRKEVETLATKMMLDLIWSMLWESKFITELLICQLKIEKLSKDWENRLEELVKTTWATYSPKLLEKDQTRFPKMNF